MSLFISRAEYDEVRAEAKSWQQRYIEATYATAQAHAALERERDRYHALAERVAGLLEPKVATRSDVAMVGQPDGPDASVSDWARMPEAIPAAIRRAAAGDARLNQHLWTWVNEPEQRARWHDGSAQGLPSLLHEITHGKRRSA